MQRREPVQERPNFLGHGSVSCLGQHDAEPGILTTMLAGELKECVHVLFVRGPKEMQQGLHLHTVIFGKWIMEQRSGFDSRELPEVTSYH